MDMRDAHNEALTLAIGEMHAKAVEPRDLYYRSLVKEPADDAGE
jgi:hypothetical protein